MSDDFDEKRYARLIDTSHRVRLTVDVKSDSIRDRRELFTLSQMLMQSLTTSQYFWVNSIDEELGQVSCSVEFKTCIGKGGYRLDKMGPFTSESAMIKHFEDKAAEILKDAASVVFIDVECHKISDSSYDPMMLM